MTLPSRILATVAFSVCAAIPGRADAQTTVSFPELSHHLRVGDVVTLTGPNGSTTKGKIAGLTDASVTVSPPFGNQMRFAGDEIRRVAIVDSRGNGALIGLAVGIIPGAILGNFIATYCDNEATSCPSAPIVLGAVTGAAGAAIGAGIDGLINRSFSVSTQGGGRIEVFPMVDVHRKAMLMSVRLYLRRNF